MELGADLAPSERKRGVRSAGLGDERDVRVPGGLRNNTRELPRVVSFFERAERASVASGASLRCERSEQRYRPLPNRRGRDLSRGPKGPGSEPFGGGQKSGLWSDTRPFEFNDVGPCSAFCAEFFLSAFRC